MSSQGPIPPGVIERLREKAQQGATREELMEWLRRTLKDQISDVRMRSAIGELLHAETNRDDGTTIVRTAGEDVSFELRGAPPRNEDDCPEVLARLGRHWRARGTECDVEELCDDPEEVGEDGVLHTSDGDRIPVQITRAVVDDDLLGRLGTGSDVQEARAPGELAVSLLTAARRKTEGRKQVPPRQRRTMVLALDAIRLAHLTFPTTIRAAADLSRDFTALGFREVLVVGPSDDLVFSLSDPDVK